MTDAQVLILGGGISGCLTACQLADVGVSVLIVEREGALLEGASRWNDGKIHLGYTFTGRGSLATASLMQRGAAAFLPTLERVLGGPLPPEVFGDPVTYLVDAQSMVDPEVLWDRARAVARLLKDSINRLPGLRDYGRLGAADGPAPAGSVIERIDPETAMAATGQREVAAAWRTTESHIATRVMADAIVRAVSLRGITVVRAHVDAAIPEGGSWRIVTSDGTSLRSTMIVNCTWESRRAIDRTVKPRPAPVSIRYKVGLFGRRVRWLRSLTPSTRILGPYGDIVTCRNGDAYLSWYPAGLLARSDDGSVPDRGPLDVPGVTQAMMRGLRLSPELLAEPGASWRLAGGHVVAHGYGDIDDLSSPLHERHRPSVEELLPGYVSVDTGKLTLGPLMATRATDVVLRRLGQVRSPVHYIT